MPGLFQPNYAFRENEEPLVFVLFAPTDDEGDGWIHAGCATTAAEREFPLYANDLHSVAHIDGVVHCAHCRGLILEASDLRARVAETRRKAVDENQRG